MPNSPTHPFDIAFFNDMDRFVVGLYGQLVGAPSYHDCQLFADLFVRRHFGPSALGRLLYQGLTLADAIDPRTKLAHSGLFPCEESHGVGLIDFDARELLCSILSRLPHFARSANEPEWRDELTKLSKDYLGKRGKWPVATPAFQQAGSCLPTSPPSMPGPNSASGFLGGMALAKALAIHPSRSDAFFRQLERKRLKLGDQDWHEVRDPKANHPKFLYRADSPTMSSLAARYREPKLT